MKVDIKKISKLSGYGVGTVSRALSSPSYNVSEKARKAILRVAERYNYSKDLSAQTLAKGKSADFGLVIPAIFESLFYNDFFMKLIAGATKTAYENGFNLRILLMKPDDDHSVFIRDIRSLKLSGLLLSSYCGNFYLDREKINELGTQTILIGDHIEHGNCSSIVLDDFKGGYDGVSYLAALGHKDIGVIRGIKKDIEERFAGFRKAMEWNELRVNNEYVLSGDATEASGYKETLKLLTQKRKHPTAIFALDDEMAAGAIRAIKDAGLDCPRNVSVLGYDGMDIGSFTDPALTTMSRPAIEMGRRAVLALLGKSELKKGECLKIEAELIKRFSCRTVS